MICGKQRVLLPETNHKLNGNQSQTEYLSIFRGGVQFPTGGKVRDPAQPADPLQVRNQQ